MEYWSSGVTLPDPNTPVLHHSNLLQGGFMSLHVKSADVPERKVVRTGVEGEGAMIVGEVTATSAV